MIVHLTELGPAGDVERLPPDLKSALAPLVSITDRGARSEVRQRRLKVGMLRAGDTTVYVEPKITLPQLLLLLDYKNDPVEWRDPTTGAAEAGDLAAAVGDVYAGLAERALSQGPLQGYRPAATSSPVLRGRLRLADQLAAHRGVAYPFEITYPRFGPDVPENRILKAAALEMLALPRLRPATRDRLRRIMRQLDAVGPPTGEPWRPDRRNAHYLDALRLAETALRGSAFRPAPGAVPACGFVLDMDRVFEDFVCAALDEALQARARGAQVPRWESTVDVGGLVTIRPDFTFLAGGTPVAVADAKYKVDFTSKRDDIYQMIVYCTALGLPRGHLVYAQSGLPRREHEVRFSGVRIVQHALDLTAPRDRLLAAVDAIADELAADIPAAASQ